MTERRRVGFAEEDPAPEGGGGAPAAAASSTVIVAPPPAAAVSPRTPKGILKHGGSERKKFVVLCVALFFVCLIHGFVCVCGATGDA